jgi:hypothetical protein
MEDVLMMIETVFILIGSIFMIVGTVFMMIGGVSRWGRRFHDDRSRFPHGGKQYHDMMWAVFVIIWADFMMMNLFPWWWEAFSWWCELFSWWRELFMMMGRVFIAYRILKRYTQNEFADLGRDVTKPVTTSQWNFFFKSAQGLKVRA